MEKVLTCLYKPNDCYNESCVTEKRCKDSNDKCIAFIHWIDETANKSAIRYADCFPDKICSGNKTCIAPYQIATAHSTDFYCCCSESMCNKNYKLVKLSNDVDDGRSIINENHNNSLLKSINGVETTVIVAGIVLFLLILTVITVLIYKRRLRQLAKKRQNNRDIENNTNKQLNEEEKKQEDVQQQQPLQQLPSQVNPFMTSDLLKHVNHEKQALLINSVALAVTNGVDIVPSVTIESSANNINNNSSNNTNNLVIIPIVDLNNINLNEKISHSQISAVWKGTFKCDMLNIGVKANDLCAVKVFPNYEKVAWSNEKEIYSYLYNTDCEFILKFIGAEIFEGSYMKDYWLITEYQTSGSLYDFLRKNTLSWQQVCNFTLSVLSGLAYLHSESPKSTKPSIAHRDLKSKNVLVKSNGTCCIADFGLALVLKNGKLNGSDIRSQVGTRRYMSPELLEGAITFSKDTFMRIDVYACALVLWEIISRGNFYGYEVSSNFEIPYEKEVGLNPSLDDMQDLVVHKNKRPIIRPEWSKPPGMATIIQTIEDCWDIDVEGRVSSECAAARLKKCLTLNYTN